MVASTAGSSVPITTRSGRRKSSTAAPSFRNSGFETIARGWVVRLVISLRTRAAVPTGTVDFKTTVFGPFMARAMPRETSRTAARSAAPLASWGVPTATKMTSLPLTAASRSVENRRRSSVTFLGNISARPGS